MGNKIMIESIFEARPGGLMGKKDDEKESKGKE